MSLIPAVLTTTPTKLLPAKVCMVRWFNRDIGQDTERSTGVATLRDVAEALGVSVSTVSRGLSGHPHVDERTRVRIREAARRLNYQPNALARALRSNRTKTVGLVIPDILNQFYAAGATVLQATLERHGYRLIVCINNDEPGDDAECLTALLQYRVDGIVHVPCTPTGAQGVRDVDPRAPVVELNRRSDAGLFDAVISDDHEGARALVRHLADLGHESIGVIAGPPSLSTTRGRIEGLETGLREVGIAPDRCPVLYGSYTKSWGIEAVERLVSLHPRPTAIFATGNRVVAGALHGLAKAGLHIPRDISVIGYDDPDWFAEWRPAITTYALPLRDMGRMAAELLLARMAEPPSVRSRPTLMRLTGHLIVRESTGPPLTVSSPV